MKGNLFLKSYAQVPHLILKPGACICSQATNYQREFSDHKAFQVMFKYRDLDKRFATKEKMPLLFQ